MLEASTDQSSYDENRRTLGSHNWVLSEFTTLVNDGIRLMILLIVRRGEQLP